MGSEVAAGKGVLDEIARRALDSAVEVCGLLLGSDVKVTEVVHCRNVATDPAAAFEIDPGQLIAALKATRAGGPQVLGCYHSHPGGVPEPSPRDAADAAPNGWLWVIVGGREVRMYRAVESGELLGRFEPVGWQATET